MLLSLFFFLNQTFAAQEAPVEKSNIACAESQGELQEKKKSQSGKPHGGELSHTIPAAAPSLATVH